VDLRYATEKCKLLKHFQRGDAYTCTYLYILYMHRSALYYFLVFPNKMIRIIVIRCRILDNKF